MSGRYHSRCLWCSRCRHRRPHHCDCPCRGWCPSSRRCDWCSSHHRCPSYRHRHCSHHPSPLPGASNYMGCCSRCQQVNLVSFIQVCQPINMYQLVHTLCPSMWIGLHYISANWYVSKSYIPCVWYSFVYRLVLVRILTFKLLLGLLNYFWGGGCCMAPTYKR
jgi:hypothetical protein